ncbi:MAG: adenosine kinase [Dysgonamonadaceae bacterium]|jgi:sugar/nucleoside kinase (ribokinase family)|nr:adenosine kinase [Dysgonamonadaceae bacterium]
MKILGIGNALIDVLAKLKDDILLNELNLPKGSMNLIDVRTRNKLLDKVKHREVKMTTGGSAGNTSLALAKMGMDVGFIGKVGEDKHGSFYVNEMNDAGIRPHFIFSENPSGTAIVLITPDGERTFGTYLGVAADLRKEELQEEIFRRYTHFYIEGYLVQNHALIEGALIMAKSCGLTTALDLASYNVVETEKEFLQELIDKYVDIVFANEMEAHALTGKNPEEAVVEIGNKVQIAVVKTGGDGSWVKQGNELLHVPVEKILPLDTTAAGDYYAAGFFYGLAQNASIKQCAQTGSLLASEIIRVVGTQLPDSTWEAVKRKANEIINH